MKIRLKLVVNKSQFSRNFPMLKCKLKTKGDCLKAKKKKSFNRPNATVVRISIKYIQFMFKYKINID